MLTGCMWTSPLTGSNCYILAEGDRCIVIDPNDKTESVKLLESLGWVPELILLTHEHCDHVEGLEPLRRRFPSARTAATLSCSLGLQDDRLNMSRRMEIYLALSGKAVVSYPSFTCRPAELTYEGRRDLDWRGHRLQLLSLPGHTKGSAGIFFDDRLFFSGDYLLPGLDPVLRLPGGDEAAYRSHTLPLLDQLPETLLICPGHGGPYRRGEEK